jgi:poly-gamma-glutamate capsule biosynthesis protein CapA/YwtB (metallophosphatase superfamily)
LTITFGGDVMLARGGEPIVEDWQELNLSLPAGLSGGSARSNALYVANLESPLTDNALAISGLENADMNLCAGSEEVTLLDSAGFDLMTTSNNHQDDCTEDGILQTNKLLESAGFQTMDDVNGTWVKTLPEENLVFVGVNDVTSQIEEVKLLEVIRVQKEHGRFVVISAHWGNEYQAGPDLRQEQLAQDWVDAGADVIWGHHPHVLQRMEWLTSGVDGHKALVMYSLGNLVSDQHMLTDTQRSALVQLKVRKNRIFRVVVAPFKMDWNSLKLSFELTKVEHQKILERLKTDPLSNLDVAIGIFSP